MATARVAIILGSENKNAQAKNSMSPLLDNMQLLTFTSVSEFINRSIELDHFYSHVIIHENQLGVERGPVLDAELDSRVAAIQDLETYISEGRDETRVVLICRNNQGYRSGIDLNFVEDMGNPNTTPVILSSIKIPLLVEFIQSDVPELVARYYTLEKDQVKVGDVPADVGTKPETTKKAKSRRLGRRRNEEPTSESKAPADGTPTTQQDEQGNTVKGEFFGGVFRALEFYDEHGRSIPVAYGEDGSWYPMGRYEEGSNNLIELAYDEEGNSFDMGYNDDQGRYVKIAYDETGNWYALGEYDDSDNWIENTGEEAGWSVSEEAVETHEAAVEASNSGFQEVSNGFEPVSNGFESVSNGFDDIPSASAAEVPSFEAVVSGADSGMGAGWATADAGSGATGFLDTDDQDDVPDEVIQEPATQGIADFSNLEGAWSEVSGGSGATSFLDDEEEDEPVETPYVEQENNVENDEPVSPGGFEAVGGFGVDVASGFGEAVGGFGEAVGGFAEVAGGFEEASNGFSIPEVPLVLPEPTIPSFGFEEGVSEVPSNILGDVPEVEHVQSVADIPEVRMGVAVAPVTKRPLPVTSKKVTVVAGTGSAEVAYNMAKASNGKALLIDFDHFVNGTISELSSKIRFLTSVKGIAQDRKFSIDGFDFMSNGLGTKLSFDDIDWVSSQEFEEYSAVIIHAGWGGLWAIQSLLNNDVTVEILVDGTETGLIDYVMSMSNRENVNDDLAERLWGSANFSVHGHESQEVVTALRSIVVVDRLDWLKKVA